MRIDIRLTQLYPDFSRSRIKGLIEAGFVKVNGVAVLKASTKVSDVDVVEVEIPPPVPAEPEPEDIPLSILFEDEDILVVDKPAGLVVHPAPGHHTGTLVNAVLHHCPDLKGIGGVARPGIVHRLDQDTSGVMIIAKSQPAMDRLTKEFASHANIRKTYLAVVRGYPVPAEGRIENLIGRSPFDRKKMAIVEKNGKAAITEYSVLARKELPLKPDIPGRRSEVFSLVRCRIETGRTHQIRVHMKSLGCPISGDAVYGSAADDRRLAVPPPRQLLHAWKLELAHPVTRKPVVFTASVPECFSAFAECLDSLPMKDGVSA
jgi:23S rRNA pseudouridine1911/1915/1917 synthase